MKKCIAIVMVLAMLLSLTGCVDVQGLLERFEQVQNSSGGQLNGPDASRPGGLFGTEPSTAPSIGPAPTVPTPDEDIATTAPPEPTQSTEGESKRHMDVTLWAPEELVELLYAQIDWFNRTNDLGVEMNVEIVSVPIYDCAVMIAADPENAPDLFCLTQDYLPRLVEAGALQYVGERQKNWMQDMLDPTAVVAASYQSDAYAYPMAMNNGYFMYYDKSVLSEQDIQSLEQIIAVCERNGRTFCMDLNNGWYLPAFFFATGCVSEWQMDADGNFFDVYDTFNSWEGQLAIMGMQKLLESDCYRCSGTVTYFNNRAAAVVSGAWEYDAARAALGDNLGVAALPSFTADGNRYHMSSFSGYILMGMKPQFDSERSEILNALLQYLCDEACQLQRLELQYAPTHKAALESGLLNQYPTLKAMAEQGTYSRPQGQIAGAWWDIVKMIPELLQEGYCDAETILQLYEAELWEIIHPEEMGWSVIGSIDGSNWDEDIPLIEAGDGVFVSQWAIWLDTDSEYKIRWNRSWNENYGQNGERDGANCAPGLSGYYYIWFNAYTHESWLQPT